MEQLVIGIVVMGIAIFVRRKEALVFRWQPSRHTWVAIGAGLLAFFLSASLLLFETESLAARLIHYGGLYVVCGVVIPWGYTLLVERERPAAMGLRRERWAVSLVLSLILASLFLPLLLLEGNLSAVGVGQLSRAVIVLAGAGGLFELFYTTASSTCVWKRRLARSRPSCSRPSSMSCGTPVPNYRWRPIHYWRW
jgi:hypothetical protein